VSQSVKGVPSLAYLSQQDLETIHETALDILEGCGVYFDSDEAMKILKEAGCWVDEERKIAKFPRSLVLGCIESAPEKIALYDREGEYYTELGDQRCHFDPGSSPANMLLSDGKTVRESISDDMRTVVKVADFLPQMDFQSTAVVCGDLPDELGDLYRLYLIMIGSKKPVVTGAFDVPGIRQMYEMIKVVRGSDEAVAARPYAIFDICASPPLKWSHISSQNIIDCARLGLPAELIAMPMPGAASPVTLAGSVAQDVAEVLSGLTLGQVVKKGAPVIYAGAPVRFDMRTGTTPMSAIEGVMLSSACAQMARYYGLPSHTYAALSDSKIVDTQAGYETALSGLLAALSGINVISGAGTLDVVGIFSIEKLIIDAEIIAMIQKALQGIAVTPETLAKDLIMELGPGGDYLTTKHTKRWFKKEQHHVGPVTDHRHRADWEHLGGTDTFARARHYYESVIKDHPGSPLEETKKNRLAEYLQSVAAGLDVEIKPGQL
jgi:trimethylamine--corrinoid protein Co-methyltransferase